MIDMIHIFFRCIDFVVIISMIFFSVKKYLIPAVEKIAREYGLFIYNLESDCKKLQLQTQSILENIQDQDRHFTLLEERFQAWHTKRHEQIKLQRQKQEKINEQMQERYRIRSIQVYNDYAMKQALPSVLHGATKALQEKHQKQDVQKQYIDALLATMKVTL